MNVVYTKIFENGAVYIGITGRFKKRMYEHEYDCRNKLCSKLLYRTYNKYKHETKIVFESESYVEVKAMEILLIKILKEKGCRLLNSTDGGDGTKGLKLSKETIEKRRQKKLGTKRSEETKRKIGIGNKGKIVSKESIEKMKLAKLGKKLTEEHKQKIKEANKGKVNSKEAFEQARQTRIKQILNGKYETLSVQRDNFRQTCKEFGLNFDDFEEVFAEKKNRKFYRYYFYRPKKE